MCTALPSAALAPVPAPVLQGAGISLRYLKNLAGNYQKVLYISPYRLPAAERELFEQLNAVARAFRLATARQSDLCPSPLMPQFRGWLKEGADLRPLTGVAKAALVWEATVRWINPKCVTSSTQAKSLGCEARFEAESINPGPSYKAAFTRFVSAAGNYEDRFNELLTLINSEAFSEKAFARQLSQFVRADGELQSCFSEFAAIEYDDFFGALTKLQNGQVNGRSPEEIKKFQLGMFQLSLEDFKKDMGQMFEKGCINSLDFAALAFCYALAKIKPNSERDLYELLEKAVVDLEKVDCSDFAHEVWHKFFIPRLVKKAHALPSALNLLSSEALRPFVEKHYGITRFPIKTLDGLIEQYPATQRAFSDEFKEVRQRFDKEALSGPSICPERKARSNLAIAVRYAIAVIGARKP